MKRNNQYVDLDGRVFLLRGLDDEERKLLAACQKYAKSHGSADYTNYWLPKVRRLYAERGLNGRQIVETPLFRLRKTWAIESIWRRGGLRWAIIAMNSSS